MFVYIIINSVNNKKYVGITNKTIDERFEAHKNNAKKKINRYLYDSMNKYGYDNFFIKLIDDTCTTWEELQKKECFYIKEYNTIYPYGYNMTAGGDGGYTTQSWTKERREELYKKQGNSRIGHTMSVAGRLAVGNATKERYKQMTDEEKLVYSEKISTTLKNKGCKPPIYRGGNGGHKHTNEEREKISMARKGKKYEDIFDLVTSEKLKELHRELFTGTNNPNYIEITKESKIAMLGFLMFDRERLIDSCNKAGISLWAARNILHSLNIYNYQKWSYNKTKEEISTFANEVINEIRNS